MRIVHINYSDVGGGAAIACARHCEAMLQSGIDAAMLTIAKSTHKPFVRKYHFGARFFTPLFNGVRHDRLLNKLHPIGTFSVMKYGQPLYKDKAVREADVIFLHWVNYNCLNIKGIEKILRMGKPTYWYMHDMFPITGGCHHSLGCEGYQDKCTECPLIKNEKGIASKQLQSKLKHWAKYKNLAFITPSTWLGSCVEKSILAKGHKVHVVPNVIDTDLFKPLPFETKIMFGLDPNKKTILFSADLSGSVYKGSEYTIDCLKRLDPDKYEGLVIGNMPKGLQEVIPIKIIATGYLMDSLSLMVAYNACDTFVISSIAENYPNVVMEAMACGRPCVGFKTGGIPDFIHHKINGYLAANCDSKELFQGIEFLFEDKNRYNLLSNSARRQIVEINDYNRCSYYLHTLGIDID